jgi:hypothetical protein
MPVCSVGAADHHAFLSYCETFPAVDTSGVFAIEGPTNMIHLYANENGGEQACTKHVAPPIPYDRIKKHLNADGILINMASGSDITLDTLDTIRMEIRPRETPVHFDYHNLTMGVSRDAVRFRRPLPDWRRWAFMITTIQLNEEEIAGLALENLKENQAVGHLLTLGVKGVILTRGARGATVFSNEHKKVVHHDVAANSVEGTVDTTGLGDVFGASFLYKYVATSDLIASAEFATRTAGEAAARPGTVRLPVTPQP